MKNLLLWVVFALTWLSYCFSMSGDIIGHRQDVTSQKEYVFSENNNHLLILPTDGNAQECRYNIENVYPENKLMEISFLCPQPDWEWYAEYHEIEFVSENEIIDIGYIQWIAMWPSSRFIKIWNRGSKVSDAQWLHNQSNNSEWVSQIEYVHFLFIIPVLLWIALIFLIHKENSFYGSWIITILLIGSIWLPLLPLITLWFGTKKITKILTVVYVVALLSILAINWYGFCWKWWCFRET